MSILNDIIIKLVIYIRFSKNNNYYVIHRKTTRSFIFKKNHMLFSFKHKYDIKSHAYKK